MARRGGVFREGQAHAQQARRFVKAAHVVGQAKHEELALVLVPVAANASEHAGAVVERVGQKAQLRLGVGEDAVVKEGHAGKSHGCLLGSTLDSNCELVSSTLRACITRGRAGYGLGKKLNA